ncbi:hypothetical protein N7495_001642 [Penicillium taxi]|uniref:uncharacterized protein n=1 Tax=Penicillium taxi TaxID=168475 RepID=UPI002544F2C7|nr:uncharacterized protein N7495_001642 [Penicillium taxi]KAJ5908960.1 hypothetical protein N7495_001642 [Penicillium taxi]
MIGAQAPRTPISHQIQTETVTERRSCPRVQGSAWRRSLLRVPAPASSFTERCATTLQTLEDSTSRIDHLEGKLDEIASYLTAPANTTLRANFNPSSSLFSTLPPSAMNAHSTFSMWILPSIEITPDDAIIHFRSKMLKYFPYVYVPCNASWLEQERPFTLLCIMNVTSQATETKLALGARIKQILTHRVYVDDDPLALNLDLVMGLLVWIVWGYDHMLHGTVAKVSRWMQLAISIVFDLGLGKPPQEQISLLADGVLSSGKTVPTRSIEERRAVLGCYVMSLVASSYWGQRQMDPMLWTLYMDECMDVLAHSRDSPFDQMLVHQVQLQRIAGEIESTRVSMDTRAEFFVTLLQQKIMAVKVRIPPHLQQDGNAFGLLQSTENSPDFQKFELLYQCLETAKLAIDNFCNIPSAELPRVSIPFYTHFARAMLVVYELSVRNDPNWDTALVRSTVDILALLDTMISRIQEARALMGELANGGVLDKSLSLYTHAKNSCAQRLAEMMGVSESDNYETQQVTNWISGDTWLREQFF